jgi:hypothetical protein
MCLSRPASASTGVEEENRQMVLSVTNTATFEQTWFNRVRSQKPQTFKAEATASLDPVASGITCDFCDWRSLTAEDSFGRSLREAHPATLRDNCMSGGQPDKY